MDKLPDFSNLAPKIPDVSNFIPKMPDLSDLTFKGIDWSKYDMLTSIQPIQMPEINYEDTICGKLDKANEQRQKVAEYLESIKEYNQQLVYFNMQLLRRINKIEDTMDFMNELFKDKVDEDRNNNVSHNALLLEMIKTIEDKDSSKFEKFLTTVGAPMSVALFVEYIKMQFGFV